MNEPDANLRRKFEGELFPDDNSGKAMRPLSPPLSYSSLASSSTEEKDFIRIDPRASSFYREAMKMLKEAGIPFLIRFPSNFDHVGGAYASAHYTQVSRRTKDFDIFCMPEDAERILDMFASKGFHTELRYPSWLGKIWKFYDEEQNSAATQRLSGLEAEDHKGFFMDVIWNSSNSLTKVDATWFENAVEGEILGQKVQVCSLEDHLWCKSWIMERERYDGADMAHCIRVCSKSIDWPRLLSRFDLGHDHYRILLSHLTLFGFIYPDSRHLVPSWIHATLLQRFVADQFSAYVAVPSTSQAIPTRRASSIVESVSQISDLLASLSNYVDEKIDANPPPDASENRVAGFTLLEAGLLPESPSVSAASQHPLAASSTAGGLDKNWSWPASSQPLTESPMHIASRTVTEMTSALQAGPRPHVLRRKSSTGQSNEPPLPATYEPGELAVEEERELRLSCSPPTEVDVHAEQAPPAPSATSHPPESNLLARRGSRVGRSISELAPERIHFSLLKPEETAAAIEVPRRPSSIAIHSMKKKDATEQMPAFTAITESPLEAADVPTVRGGKLMISSATQTAPVHHGPRLGSVSGIHLPIQAHHHHPHPQASTASPRSIREMPKNEWVTPENRESGSQHVCQGTLLSYKQFLFDVQEGGYQDAREPPFGQMTKAEITEMTEKMLEERKHAEI